MSGVGINEIWERDRKGGTLSLYNDDVAVAGCCGANWLSLSLCYTIKLCCGKIELVGM